MDDATTERFEALFRAHYGLVHDKALFLLRNRADAEDIASEVFFKLFRGLERRPDMTTSRGALLRITTHACIDRWRSARHANETLMESLNGLASMVEPQDEAMFALVDTIMEKLPTRLRVVAVLHYIDGLTVRETALAVGSSERTIKRRLEAIRSRLADLLPSDHGAR